MKVVGLHLLSAY